MVEKKKSPKRGMRTPLGDRRQFLTMMSAEIIKAIKQTALGGVDFKDYLFRSKSNSRLLFGRQSWV